MTGLGEPMTETATRRPLFATASACHKTLIARLRSCTSRIAPRPVTVCVSSVGQGETASGGAVTPACSGAPVPAGGPGARLGDGAARGPAPAPGSTEGLDASALARAPAPEIGRAHV